MTTEMIPDNSVTKLAEQTKNAVNVPVKLCQNCGTQLTGSFCSKCGQPEDSFIQFFGYVVMRFLDDIFGFDSRAGRTFLPLIFKPGFLTNEYIRGRRVHYVPPVRLYFFVSIVFFIMLGFFTEDSTKDLVGQQQEKTSIFKTVNNKIINLEEKMAEPDYILLERDQLILDELLDQRQNTEKGMRETIVELQELVGEIEGREVQAGYVVKPSDTIQKVAFNHSITLLKGSLAIIPKESDGDNSTVLIPEESIEPSPVNNIVKIGNDKSGRNNGGFNIDYGDGFDWLSETEKQRLNEITVELSQKATKAFEKDASPLIKQILGVLPQMMFVLLPIFALLLKVFYLFSKRYYMEHLTVALHSHAFIFVSLMLLALLSTLQESLVANYGTLASLIDNVSLVLLLWIPIYLYIMQKKVYRQGHLMTSIKFALLGFSYFMLLAFTSIIAFIWGLAQL